MSSLWWSLLFMYCLCCGGCHCFRIVNATWHFKTADFVIEDHVHLMELRLSFDEPVWLAGRPINQLNRTFPTLDEGDYRRPATCPPQPYMCLSKFDHRGDTCRPWNMDLAPFWENDLKLVCPDHVLTTKATLVPNEGKFCSWNKYAFVEHSNWMWPADNSHIATTSFFYHAGWAEYLHLEAPKDPRRITLLVPWDIRFRTRHSYPRPPPSAIPQCTWDLTGMHGIITNEAGDAVENPIYNTWFAHEPECLLWSAPQLVFGSISNVFSGVGSAVVKAEGNSTFSDVIASVWELGLILLLDDFEGCPQRLEFLLERETQLVRAERTWTCFNESHSTGWHADVCCRDRRWDETCYPRAQEVTVSVITGVNTAALEATNPSQRFRGVLQDYVRHSNSANNPATGCKARQEEQKRIPALLGSVGWAITCTQNLLQGKQICRSDAECPCDLRCDLRVQQCETNVDKIWPCLLDCVMGNLTLDAELYLRRTSNILDLDDEDGFAEFLRERWTLDACVGPTATNYIPGLDQQGIIEGMQPPTEEGLRLCESEHGRCFSLTPWPGFSPVTTTFRDPSVGGTQHPETGQFITVNRTQCPPFSTQWEDGICVACDTTWLIAVQPNTFCERLVSPAHCVIDVPLDNVAACDYFGGALTRFGECSAKNVSTHFDQVHCRCGAAEGMSSPACSEGHCYLPNIPNKSSCSSLQLTTPVALSWDAVLGRCLAATRADPNVCAAYGGVWSPPLAWKEAKWDTPAKCAAGACLVDGTFWGAGSDCQQSECFGVHCPACTAVNQLPGLCWEPDADAVACVLGGGEAATVPGTAGFVCYHTLIKSQQACTHTWSSCAQITDRATCDDMAAASRPFPPSLGLACFWNERARCSEAQCAAHPGHCQEADVVLEQFVPGLFPFCAVPPPAFRSGCPVCPPTLQSKFGCVDPLASNVTACAAAGGQWIDDFSTRSSCETASQGCYFTLQANGGCPGDESDLRTRGFHPLSRKDCLNEGGVPQSTFDWKVGIWAPRWSIDTKWVPEPWEPLNKRGSLANFLQIRDDMGRGGIDPIILPIISDMICQIGVFARSLPELICELSPHVPDSIDCTSVGGATVGSIRLCRRLGVRLQLGNVLIVGSETVVLPNVLCAELLLEVIGSSQFRVSKTATVSSDALFNSASVRVNEWSVVRNSYGDIVGQLMTDGVNITLSTTTRSIGVNHTTGEGMLTDELVICVDMGADIEWASAAYPLLMWASTSDLSTFIPVTTIYNVSLQDNAFCGSGFNRNGAWFPVAVVANWRDRQASSDVENLMYVLGVGYTIEFVAAAAGFILHVVSDKSFKPTLQRALMALLIAHGALRTAYAFLFAEGELVTLAEKNTWLFVILSEAPIYIFFTLYSTMALFWASILHATTIRIGFIENMRLPAVVVNAVVWGLFLAVVIVNETVTDDNALDVISKLYKLLLTALSVAAVLAFGIYGFKLLRQQVRGQRLRGSKHSLRDTKILKITALMIVVSTALILQITWLVYTTWGETPSVGLAFAVLVVIEVLPAYALIILLFMPAKISQAIEARRVSRSKSRSGSLGLTGGSGANTGRTRSSGGGSTGSLSNSISGGEPGSQRIAAVGKRSRPSDLIVSSSPLGTGEEDDTDEADEEAVEEAGDADDASFIGEQFDDNAVELMVLHITSSDPDGSVLAESIRSKWSCQATATEYKKRRKES